VLATLLASARPILPVPITASEEALEYVPGGVAELGRRIGTGLIGDLRKIVEGGEGTGECEGNGVVLGPGEVDSGLPVSPTEYKSEGQMRPRLLGFLAWNAMSIEYWRETDFFT